MQNNLLLILCYFLVLFITCTGCNYNLPSSKVKSICLNEQDDTNFILVTAKNKKDAIYYLSNNIDLNNCVGIKDSILSFNLDFDKDSVAFFISRLSTLIKITNNANLKFYINLNVDDDFSSVDKLITSFKKFRLINQIVFISKNIMLLKHLKRKFNNITLALIIEKKLREEIGQLGFMPEFVVLLSHKSIASFKEETDLNLEVISNIESSITLYTIDTIYYEKIIGKKY